MLESTFATIKNYKEVNDYLFQFNILNLTSRLFGEPLRNKEVGKRFTGELLKSVYETIEWDRRNIANGIYPADISPPKSLFQKTRGFLKILKNYLKDVVKVRT